MDNFKRKHALVNCGIKQNMEDEHVQHSYTDNTHD